MLQFAVLLPIMYGLVLGQTPCGTSTVTSTFTPVVMRYTPFMTAQVGPTSTIWDQIVTTWFNAVDCRYVTPIRVDENPIAEGPFTTFVRSPVLTVTRVGCMPETTAVTRRNFRGQENQLELRTVGIEQGHKIHKRRTAKEAIDEVVNDLSDKFPPEIAGLTLQAYRFLVSVNTAIFGIHLVQAGIDLNQTCTHLRDPAFQAQLFRTTIDPIQAGDIVCFAANNGLYFRAGIDNVVTYLESLVYAIQVRPSFPADSDDFCWPSLTEDSPFLGIDTNGISQYLCPSGNIPAGPTTATSSVPFVTRTTGTTAQGSATRGTIVGTVTASGTATSSLNNGTLGTVTTVGPSTGGPYANTTANAGTIATTTQANATTITIDTSATSPPYANSTTETPSPESTTDEVGTISTFVTGGTYGTGYSYTNATSSYTYTGAGTGVAGTGSGVAWETGNLPPVPTAISPPIESVSSTPSRRFRRW